MRRREFIAGLGSAAVWPVVANTQQLARPTIGYLSGATAGNAPALAAKSATSSIPIVFQLGGDPIELGLVASLSRPGGNLTGAVFLTQELTAKRLELLHEIAPSASTIGYLINPANPGWDARMRAAEIAARALNLRLIVEKTSTAGEIDAAYPILVAQQIGALMVDSDPLFFGQRARLAALSVRHKLPAIYHARESVEDGGLMSYGANIAEAYHLAGSYAGRILKGEKPADLPVQQSTKIELVINLSTGRALGLTIPPILLGRADEVIE